MSTDLEAAQAALFKQLDQRFEQDLPGMAQDMCQVIAPWYMAVRPARCVWSAVPNDSEHVPSRRIPNQTKVAAIADGQKSHWQTIGEHTLPALSIKRCQLKQHNHTATLVLEFTLSAAEAMMTTPIDVDVFCPPGQAVVSPWLWLLCEGVTRVTLEMAGQHIELPLPTLQTAAWQAGGPDKGACLWLEWLRYPTQFGFFTQQLCFPDKAHHIKTGVIRWVLDMAKFSMVKQLAPNLQLHGVLMENRYATDAVPFERSPRKHAYLLQAPALHQTHPFAIASIRQVRSWQPEQQRHHDYESIGRFGLQHAKGRRCYSVRYLQGQDTILRWQLHFAPRVMANNNVEYMQIAVDCYQPHIAQIFAAHTIQATGSVELQDVALSPQGLPSVALQPDFAIAHWLVGHLSQRHFALDSMAGWQAWWQRCAMGLPASIQSRVLRYQHGLLSVNKAGTVLVEKGQAYPGSNLVLTFASGTFSHVAEQWLFAKIWQAVVQQHAPLTHRYCVQVVEQDA